MSGLALRTVQEELATLSALGLLTSWSNGYHRFYRANRDHPLFSHLLAIVQTSSRLRGRPSRRIAADAEGDNKIVPEGPGRPLLLYLTVNLQSLFQTRLDKPVEFGWLRPKYMKEAKSTLLDSRAS
jgi:hypothetical protein